ncbi:uracil-DNA glycosylase [Pseudomonas syringae]|uniref:uracil-DNA glycosylase n=1 Tax=Pseudomonas syringae TaxID=317 RepID=UPI001F19BF9B|nr:uracil-DNA glycosylase [Pseudomonas syringae]MCF5710181.1 uracil-DNA glycosylase [Pseudomonas syringae]
MKLHPFVETIVKLHLDNCFNPYSDRCEIHDSIDAPSLRAQTLSNIIYSATSRPIDAIWIGRDLGYRGGRRTGLALTDDAHIENHAKRFNLFAERPTIGNAVTERTAAVIWNMLDQVDAQIFLWNVFPLHPHAAGEQFTNRQHNTLERKIGEELLKELIRLLNPSRIVAIGNDAAASASRITNSIPVLCVRHPSYGGQNIFLAQVSEIYGCSPRQKTLL